MYCFLGIQEKLYIDEIEIIFNNFIKKYAVFNNRFNCTYFMIKTLFNKYLRFELKIKKNYNNQDFKFICIQTLLNNRCNIKEYSYKKEEINKNIDINGLSIKSF